MHNVQTFLTHHQKYHYLYGLSISPEGALLSPASLTLCQYIISVIGDFIGSCLARVGISRFDNVGAVRNLLQASITLCTNQENYIQAAGLFPQLKAIASLYPTHLTSNLIERIDKCMRMAVKKRWEGLSHKLCLSRARCLIEKHKSLVGRWEKLTRRLVQSNRARLQKDVHVEFISSLPERTQAASKIQRAWRAHRLRIDDSGPVGDWLSKFHTDFIAHAIWPANVTTVLESGEVQPAEMVLRRTKHAECEQGAYSMRGEYQLPEVDLDEDFRARVDALWPQHILKCEQPLKKHPEILYYKFYTHANFVELDEIHGLVRQKASSLSLSEIGIRIFLDMRAAKKVDQVLFQDYETLLKAGHRLEEAHRMCIQAREFSFSRSSLNPEIRAGDNHIFWSYGDVVVLRGNARNIIACKLGLEVALLAPFQNHGEFFTLSLNHPETVVLGPRAILEPYKGRFSVVYIEDLTRRQRNFFRVPIELDPEQEKLKKYFKKKP